MEENEILFVDAKFDHKNKTYCMEEIVYKHNNQYKYWDYIELKKKLGINDPVVLYDIKILKRLGFANKSKRYTEAIKSDEKRDKITGKYD